MKLIKCPECNLVYAVESSSLTPTFFCKVCDRQINKKEYEINIHRLISANKR